MADITLAQLTEKKLDGAGVFDVILQTLKLHLDTQYRDNRITGPEYAEVYLGQVQAAMQHGMNFLLQREQVSLQAQLLEQQVLIAKEQVLQAKEQTELVKAQLLLANAQLLQTQAQTAQIEKQSANLAAEKLLIEANASKVTAETLNVPKQGQVIDAQKAQIAQQTANLTAEAAIIPKQGLLLDAQTAVATQQKLNAAEELKQTTAQTALVTSNKAKVDAETLNVPKQGKLLDAQLVVATQEGINSEVQKRVLEGQVCKLQAEFDYTKQNTLKATAEVTLIGQKTATEKAQVLGIGVDADSVIGKQKTLYTAQADGFKRDAEQKAAKLYVDVWSAQRMTDPDATPASVAHGLSPDLMKMVMDKLRAGIGAV